MPTSDTRLDGLSEIYHALRAPRRRLVIRLLAQSDSQLSVRALGTEIAAIEEGIPPEQATGEPYRNVYNALAQTHLECLSDADIVCYNSDRQLVTTGAMFCPAVLLLRLNRTAYQTLLRNSSLGDEIQPSIAD